MLAMVNYHHDHWSNRPWVYWLGMCAVAALLAELEFGWFKALSGFLFKWQTLTAGLIAISGAFFTVRAMRRKEGEEQKRKQRAAIFPLGNALSEVCRYSQSGMAYLIALGMKPSEFDETLSQETIEVLKEITEWFEGDEGIATGVIGPKYQLCRARSESNVGRPTDDYRYEVICDFAELHALASRLFSLSRGKKEQITTGDVSRQEIDTALFDADRGLHQWRTQENVRAFLDRRYGV